MTTLVIVPCGRAKIWDVEPKAGPTPAREAYRGAPFKVNKEYAVRFADRWVILSAKYGFIDPDFSIPANYNVTFTLSETCPITSAELQRQAGEEGLLGFQTVVALGSTTYAQMVREAFRGSAASVITPMAGLPLGRAMAEVKRAIEERRPFSPWQK